LRLPKRVTSRSDEVVVQNINIRVIVVDLMDNATLDDLRALFPDVAADRFQTDPDGSTIITLLPGDDYESFETILNSTVGTVITGPPSLGTKVVTFSGIVSSAFSRTGSGVAQLEVRLVTVIDRPFELSNGIAQNDTAQGDGITGNWSVDTNCIESTVTTDRVQCFKMVMTSRGCTFTGTQAVEFDVNCDSNTTACPVEPGTKNAKIFFDIYSGNHCAAAVTLKLSGEVSVHRDGYDGATMDRFTNDQIMYHQMNVRSADASLKSSKIISVQLIGNTSTGVKSVLLYHNKARTDEGEWVDLAVKADNSSVTNQSDSSSFTKPGYSVRTNWSVIEGFLGGVVFTQATVEVEYSQDGSSSTSRRLLVDSVLLDNDKKETDIFSSEPVSIELTVSINSVVADGLSSSTTLSTTSTSSDTALIIISVVASVLFISVIVLLVMYFKMRTSSSVMNAIVVEKLKPTTAVKTGSGVRRRSVSALPVVVGCN